MSKKSKYSPEQEKKRLTCRYGFLSFIFYIICFLAPVGLMVLNFSTITDVVGSGNHTILYGGGGKYEDACDDAFSSHRPVRFSFGKGEPIYMCTWSSTNNGLRLTLCFVSVAILCLCFFFTFIRRSRNMYFFGLLLLVCAVLYGILGYKDSDHVAKSNSWCEGDMRKDVIWNNKTVLPPITCQYAPLIFVPVLDFVIAVLWVFLSFFAICFVCKAGPGKGSLRKGKLLPREYEPDDRFGPEEEEEDAPRGDIPRKKKGGLFGSRNQAQRIPDEPEDEGGPVNFEKESASRFAPMSKTDREVKDLPLGRNNAGNAGGQTVGNALFNFDDLDSSQGQKPAAQPQPQPAPEPVKAAPAPQPAPQPQPAKSGGMVDFEALSVNGGNDPFFA